MENDAFIKLCLKKCIQLFKFPSSEPEHNIFFFNFYIYNSFYFLTNPWRLFLFLPGGRQVIHIYNMQYIIYIYIYIYISYIIYNILYLYIYNKVDDGKPLI